MSFHANGLYALLPAIHRSRDAELARQLGGLLSDDERHELEALQAVANASEEQRERLAQLLEKLTRGPLKALVTVLSEQAQVLEENLAQLYDDQFIETCADWAVAYIGDLIGFRPVHAAIPSAAGARAEVAHTIAYRRRKGTAAMLEQLARDVTDWNARVVEYFALLGTTQYLNHTRLDHSGTPDLRRWEPLQRLGSAFDAIAHTAEVRRIASGRGRFNIPNIGIFLWPIRACPLTRSPALVVDARRLLVGPLGQPIALLTLPETEDEVTHLAEARNVPARITRRVLADYLAHYYGRAKSLIIYRGGAEVPVDDVLVCDLRDHAGGWAHVPPPPGKIAVDPELGRIALGTPLQIGETIEVSFHYGFLADLGGGEYERAATFGATTTDRLARVPDQYPTLAAAIDAVGHAGVVEITDSGRHHVTNLRVRVPAGETLEIRAINNRRPLLELSDAIQLAGGDAGSVILNGLLIAGHRLEIPDEPGNRLGAVAVRHCTLVPGWTLDTEGKPRHAGEPSLVVAIANVALEIDRSIVGAMQVHRQASATISDSIIDATDRAAVAYGASTPGGMGGALTVEACTVIGEVRTRSIATASNSIFLSRVVAVRRQTGCVRFSYLPVDSHVPRRYRCQPVDDASLHRVAPGFVSLRYGVAQYAQLRRTTAPEILQGADDEGEMGAFHCLHWPQRETNLRTRLQEYLRAGLEAGFFYQF